VFDFLKKKLKSVFAKKQPVKQKTGGEGSVKTRERKGLLKRISDRVTKKRINESDFNKIFNEVELILLQNNVALEVVERVREELKKNLLNKEVTRTQVSKSIKKSIKDVLENTLLEVSEKDFLEKVKSSSPCVILVVGVNGSGKTTTIAKLCKYFQDKGLSCVLSASDTFRAASIEQLSVHARALGVKIIKHDYGADPAAVAFDAVQHAKANNVDVVLIDTAGRQQTNINLMEELKKIDRVSKPSIKIFVGDSLTGNDVINQAIKFKEAINYDYVILSKADVDEKGGAILSISYVTRTPILFLGVGQGYEDLKHFKKKGVIEDLIKE